MDGCSVQFCDGQGPTETVLYNTNNTIFGGYLSQSWNSSDKCIKDPRAFLFRLQYNGSSNPLKFPVNDSTCAWYGHNDYGPTLVEKIILIFKHSTNTVTKSGYHSLNGSIHIQHRNSIITDDLKALKSTKWKVVCLSGYWPRFNPWYIELLLPDFFLLFHFCYR